MMEVEKTPIEGLLVLTPTQFEDDRGTFQEVYNQKTFAEATGLNIDFKQDNQSVSKSDVLRGLHFQVPPHAQAKLVRVVKGLVQDVVVDLRRSSPTYGEHFSIMLSADNRKMLFVPEGFAHGFLTLADDTIFSYKCSEIYHPESDRGLLWSDQDLNISWHKEYPQLSTKDAKSVTFREFTSPF